MNQSFSTAADLGRRVLRNLLPVALLLVVTVTPVLAAPNQATGDIAGVAADLVDSNTITINSTGNQLTLVKRAYLADGTRVPTTSSLPSGSLVDFLIYISNDSLLQVNDISLQDVLDPAFVYQTGTIRVDNTVVNCAAAVCTPAEEDNLQSILQPKTALNDGIGGDVVSYDGGALTVYAGNETQANLQLDMAGQRVWAMLFTVSVP